MEVGLGIYLLCADMNRYCALQRGCCGLLCTVLAHSADWEVVCSRLAPVSEVVNTSLTYLPHARAPLPVFPVSRILLAHLVYTFAVCNSVFLTVRSTWGFLLCPHVHGGFCFRRGYMKIDELDICIEGVHFGCQCLPYKGFAAPGCWNLETSSLSAVELLEAPRIAVG